MSEHEMQELKEVSKVKHEILGKYFPTWATILGARHRHLMYVDCFAGEGIYTQEQAGSPIIIAQEALGIARSRGLQITLIFVEKNQRKAQRLEEHLANFRAGDSGPVSTIVLRGDSHDLTAEILRAVPSNVPSFFFVDPLRLPAFVGNDQVHSCSAEVGSLAQPHVVPDQQRFDEPQGHRHT